MANTPTNEDILFLGIDGGGTRCRAILMDQNNRQLGVGNGGPANPFYDATRALKSIGAAVDEALQASNLSGEDKSRLVVGMGLAGVNIPSMFESVNHSDHPFKARYLTSDLHIASIGAHEDADGAVIVAGTGSCGFAHADGRSLELGGHGFPCGDKASGAWLGLSAVQAVLLAEDELGPPTALSELVSKQLKGEGLLIVEVLNGAKSSDYAELAPLVFEAAEFGDDVAVKIVSQGANYLNKMAQQLFAFGAERLSIIGGVSARYTKWMAADVSARIQAPLNPPEYGAVLYAKSQFYKNLELSQ